MIKAQTIINTKIITLRGGREVALVKDTIYDPAAQRVVALLVEEGGWFREAKVILLPEIHSFGEDAIIIPDETAIKKVGQVAGRIAAIARGNNYLTQTRIVTEGGKELGHVTDLYFDPHTGTVNEFEVSQGVAQDANTGKKRVPVADIITIGRDATIVKSSVDRRFVKQGEKQGIQGAAAKVRQSWEQGVHAVREQAPDTVESLRERGREAADRIQSAYYQFRDNPRTRHESEASHEDNHTQHAGVRDKTMSTDEAALLEKYRAEPAGDSHPQHNSGSFYSKANEQQSYSGAEKDDVADEEVMFTPDPSLMPDRPYGIAGGSARKKHEEDGPDTF